MTRYWLIVAGLVGCCAIIFLAGQTEARREACSYKCLHQIGRWPDEARWLGRDAKGRIRCACVEVAE